MITFLLFVIAFFCVVGSYFFVLRDASLRPDLGIVGTYYNYTLVIAAFCVAVGFLIASWFLLLLPIALAVWCAIIWVKHNGLSLGN